MKTPHALEKRASNLLKAVRRRSQSDNSIDVTLLHRERERYLASLDVKIARLRGLHPGIDERNLRRLAERLNPYAPHNEPISFFELDRPGRSPRPICTLPTDLKAKHRMAKELIEAQTWAHESIYSRPGHGRDQLICDLRATLDHREDAWLVLGDVTNCFQSIRPESIYNLSLLPDSFVEAALDVRRMRFRKKDRLPQRSRPRWQGVERSSPYPVITSLEHAGLRGLMQGSPASNSLLAVFFNDLHSRLPEGVTPFVQCDNIAVVCRSEDEASSVCEALGDYFSRHQAGPLVLRIDHKADAREGFEFLGYAFEHWAGHWLVRHSGKNLIKAVRSLTLLCDDPALTSDDALARLLSGFPSVNDETVAMLVQIIEEAC